MSQACPRLRGEACERGQVMGAQLETEIMIEREQYNLEESPVRNTFLYIELWLRFGDKAEDFLHDCRLIGGNHRM